MRVWKVQALWASSSLVTDLWITAPTVAVAFEIAMANGYAPLSAISVAVPFLSK